MKPPIGPLPPDDPLVMQAMDALKRVNEAKESGGSPDTPRRLEEEAEALFQALSDYYQRTLGDPPGTLH